jgi:hypothetical protein
MYSGWVGLTPAPESWLGERQRRRVLSSASLYSTSSVLFTRALFSRALHLRIACSRLTRSVLVCFQEVCVCLQNVCLQESSLKNYVSVDLHCGCDCYALSQDAASSDFQNKFIFN